MKTKTTIKTKAMNQMTPLSLDPNKLIQVEMTGQEYMELLSRGTKKEKHILSGLNGIMEIFKCSKSTAFKISHAEWFQPCVIMRQGKFLSFDADKAIELSVAFTKMNNNG